MISCKDAEHELVAREPELTTHEHEEEQAEEDGESAADGATAFDGNKADNSSKESMVAEFMAATRVQACYWGPQCRTQPLDTTKDSDIDPSLFYGEVPHASSS